MSDRAESMQEKHMIKVLLVHGQRIMCEGMRVLFKDQSDLELLNGVAPGEIALNLVGELKPDVTIVGFDPPQAESLEFSEQILKNNPAGSIVALCSDVHICFLEQALKVGILSLVSMEYGFYEIVNAIQAAHRKQPYMCSKIKDLLASSYLGRLQADKRSNSSALTASECEIVRLLSQGKTSQEIAPLVKLSPKTVDAYRRNIMEKLGVDSIAGLVKYAIRAGMTNL